MSGKAKELAATIMVSQEEDRLRSEIKRLRAEVKRLTACLKDIAKEPKP